MSPLKRLLGGRNRQPSLEQQIQALESRPEPELLALVQSDAQEALREAAVAHLAYSRALLDLALDDADRHRLQQAARKRLGQLLENEQLTLAALAEAVGNEKQLLTLSSYSTRAAQQALTQINDPALLLELACQGATIQTRLAAAEKITTRPELEQLQKAAQGRDKTVYKLAKQRLDHFKAKDAHQAQAEAQARVICDKLEQLLRAESDPLFEAKLSKLQQDWSALPITASDELARRYQSALEHWQQQQDARHAEAAERTAQAEAETALFTEAQARATALRAELQQWRHTLCQATEEQLAQREGETQWQALAESIETLRDTPLAAKIRQQLEREHRQLSSLRTRLQTEGSLPSWLERLKSDDPAQQNAAQQLLKPLLKEAGLLKSAEPAQDLPEPLQAVLETLRRTEEAGRAHEHTRRKHLRELESLTRQGLSAASGGQVRRARGLHRATLEKRSALEPIPTHLASKLEELDNAIERLSDWHEFAVTPKKEALIRAMQALEGTTMNPEELARKIHHLQDDWREVSKGVPHHDEALWHQFQEASHRAFEPCKAFFEEQARERKANQSKRDELIQQVQLYLDNYHWDNPVWKDVEQTLKQARREWRDAWPVPRQAVKMQEQAFEPLMDSLHARLHEAYETHRAAKEALVAQAKALSEQEDLPSAIDGAKQLQAQWKQVGQCRPRDDQALWKQFRQHCDAIFTRRQEQFDAADQTRQAQAQEATALIEQVQALTTDETRSPGEHRSQIAQLKAAFQALHNLPRERAAALQRAFQQALKTHDHQQRAARAEQHQRERQQLFTAADAVRALELAMLNGDVTTAMQEKAEATLDAVQRWPVDTESILRTRLQNARSSLSRAESPASDDALRQLCIRAEILAEQPTPEEDKARRMAFQMEQLQQGLGQPSDDVSGLLREWLTVSAVPDPAYSQLLSRFQASLA